MIPVGRLAPLKQWDMTLVEDLLTNRLFPTGLEFNHWAGYPGYPQSDDGAILLVPARYWAGKEDSITEAVARYSWLLLITTSDEESLFNHEAVVHPNCRRWIQSPREGVQYPEARFIGVGYTPHMRSLPEEPPDKGWDVFLSGQRTHIRRQEAFQALENHPNSLIFETSGFTQGMKPDVYRSEMLAAKVAPCPSGAVSPDSFRLYEALEAHCVPIVDAVSPVDGVTDYWGRLFDAAPFLVCVDWSNLPGWVEDVLAGWPANANRVAAWWMRYKRSLALGLRDDLQNLGAI